MPLIVRSLIASTLFLLTQCASPNPETVPKLASPARVEAWGPPQTIPTNDGYQRTYRNPDNEKERLKIIASNDAMYYVLYPPNLTGTRVIDGVATIVSEPQIWQQTPVAGQSVKYYQRNLPSENQGPLFRTLGRKLKAPDGSFGFYRFEVEGSKNQMQSWLSELHFVQ